MRNFIMRTQIKGMSALKKAGTVLKSNKGEGFIDTALKILISVVVGGLILSGLYMLFKDTILPTLTDKITEMFNFSG
ncbi:MAG: DUF6133 family protein [Clostridia bacterium]|nr:DUF6133 family protein [Clostridia bacterium]